MGHYVRDQNRLGDIRSSYYSFALSGCRFDIWIEGGCTRREVNRKVESRVQGKRRR